MNFLLLLAILPLISAQSSSVGNFTVIAPFDIRQGKPFNVVVRGFGLTSSLEFVLRISGVANSGSTLNMKRLTKISDQKPKVLIQFDTSKILQGSYNLSVSTTNYSKTKALTYKTNEYAFLIQTDKALYFPGDLIRFRVLAINSETKSVNPKRLPVILVRDAKGSVVLNISDTGFVKGKYQGELQLTKTPSLGFWHIEAQSGNDTGGRFIEVADVVFPRVYASLTVQSKVPLTSGVIPLTISVKESYSGLISGIATVIFKKSRVEIFKVEQNVNKTTTILDFDLISDLNASATEISNYDVSLEYADLLTNSSVADSVSFEVLPKAYSIVLSEDPYLKPGSDFNLFVVVVKYDGSPGPAGMTIDIKVESLDVSQTLELDDSGSASSSFSVPTDVSSILIEASSPDAIGANLNVTLPLSINGSIKEKRKATMRLDVFTRTPVVNEAVTVKVTISEEIEKVFCLITAKGLLLEAIEVPINFDSSQVFQTATFTFNPTFAYAPIANIIGYYVRNDGRIVTASTSVELTRDLRNYLSYSFDTMEIGAKERVEFDVMSYINSTVSLFAINQRLISLRDAISITKDEVFSSLLSFYGSTSRALAGKLLDYELIFNYYGLIFFTNIKPHHSSFHYRKRSLIAELNQASKLNQTTSVQLGASRSIKTSNPFANSFLWKNVDVKDKSGDDDSGQKGSGTAIDFAGTNLTSFVVYGVSMSAYKGIGLPSTHPIVNVFMPFFITAEFPASVKVSQVLVQGITFYNYLADDHTFDVTINKDPGYVAVELYKDWKDAGDHYTRSVFIQSGVPYRIQFTLRAVKVGYISLKISAQSPGAGDVIDRVLKVTPIGIYKTVTDSRRIIFTSNNLEVSNTLFCLFPQTGFIESDAVNMTFAADLMSRPIANLPTGLTHMPSGCGEQTLQYLVPDIVVWMYLTETNNFNTIFKATLHKYILDGYQHELIFLRNDGGFSTGGNSNTYGSTWLTAYAGWAFYLAKDIIDIDMNVLRRGLNFLAGKQKSDGSFAELFQIYQRKMSGKTNFDITLTAYVTVYLTLVLKDFPEYTSIQERAITYLEMNWHSRSDVFGLAIITYALKLAGSPKADNIMNIFFAKRTETENEIYYDTVETTSYCLLLLLVRGERLEDAGKIANYLVRISNTFGGYFYSQDTVLGIYTLFKYSLFARDVHPSLVTGLEITSNAGDQIQKIIDLPSPMVMETVKLNKYTTVVNLVAQSTRAGYITASLTCGYYEESTTGAERFDIIYNPMYMCKNKFTVQFGFRYNQKNSSTGMTAAIITMPTGFEYDSVPTNNESRYKGPYARPEPQKDGGVILYFDGVNNTFINVSVTALRKIEVNELLEGYIQVKDLYFPANQASSTFTLPAVLDTCNSINRRK